MQRQHGFKFGARSIKLKLNIVIILLHTFNAFVHILYSILTHVLSKVNDRRLEDLTKALNVLT